VGVEDEKCPGALGCIRRGFCGGLGVYRGKGDEVVSSRGVENKILEIRKAVGGGTRAKSPSLEREGKEQRG
jgi:hypothetical protein